MIIYDHVCHNLLPSLTEVMAMVMTMVIASCHDHVSVGEVMVSSLQSFGMRMLFLFLKAEGNKPCRRGTIILVADFWGIAFKISDEEIFESLVPGGLPNHQTSRKCRGEGGGD